MRSSLGALALNDFGIFEVKDFVMLTILLAALFRGGAFLGGPHALQSSATLLPSHGPYFLHLLPMLRVLHAFRQQRPELPPQLPPQPIRFRKQTQLHKVPIPLFDELRLLSGYDPSDHHWFLVFYHRDKLDLRSCDHAVQDGGPARDLQDEVLNILLEEVVEELLVLENELGADPPDPLNALN